MHKYRFQFFCLLLILGCFSAVQAADWSSASVSYLVGNGYKLPPSPGTDKDMDIITFEYASTWRYGDNFFFADISDTASSSVGEYIEWAPRFSTQKIWGVKYGGVLKDILIAAGLDIASSSALVQLYGLGFDFNFTGFDFFSLNTYIKDDLGVDGTGMQVTIAWSMSFLDKKIKFMGFLDYIGEEGSGSSKKETNLLTQPQLLWMAYDNLGLGVEYQYWQNKFGIKDLNESVPQVMVMWTL